MDWDPRSGQKIFHDTIAVFEEPTATQAADHPSPDLVDDNTNNQPPP